MNICCFVDEFGNKCELKVHGGGYCHKHYQQIRRKEGKKCKKEGCEKRVQAREYCDNHYAIYKNEGLFGGKKCCVKGCKGYVYANNICRKHYFHIRNNGKILNRTRYNLNNIILYNDYAEIIIYDIKNKEKCRSKIDLEDVDRVKKYKWCVLKKGYINNARVGRLSRFLLNIINKNIDIDHISGDIIDNRKCNLRCANRSQNNMNSKIRIDNNSGYKGIHWYKSRKRWRAIINYNKKRISLGYFKNKKNAIKSRQKAEEKYFGEFSYRKSQEKMEGL